MMEEYEKKFPVPKGVVFSEELNTYIRVDVAHSDYCPFSEWRKYRDQWTGWLACHQHIMGDDGK